jgi:hypothetical protein
LEEVLVKRELLVPLILIVGLSMLVTPTIASAPPPPQDGEVVIPFDMVSDGYAKMKMGEK